MASSSSSRSSNQGSRPPHQHRRPWSAHVVGTAGVYGTVATECVSHISGSGSEPESAATRATRAWLAARMRRDRLERQVEDLQRAHYPGSDSESMHGSESETAPCAGLILGSVAELHAKCAAAVREAEHAQAAVLQLVGDRLRQV